MEKAGFDFDYRKEFRRPLLYIGTALSVTLVFMGTTWVFSTLIQQNFTTPIIYYGSYLLEHSVMIAVSVSFIVLLTNLHRRFVVLNLHLR